MKKKTSAYKKAITIYIIFILILVIMSVIYASCCLKEYEKYDIDNFIKNSVSELSYNDLKKIINKDDLVLNKYEKLSSKEDMIKSISKELKNKDKITYELSSNTENNKYQVYDVYFDKVLAFEITLNKGESKSKLILLNYDVLKVKKIESKITNGLYKVNVTIPGSYKLYINNILDDNKKDNSNELMSLVSKYSKTDNPEEYDEVGFVNKPNILVKDKNDKTVKTITTNGNVSVKDLYYTTNDSTEANKKLVSSIDIISIAEKYSLFLTDDLAGSQHGFGTLSSYLIEGTKIYDMSYKWGTGINVTFTSNHTFKNQKFTNEKLTNFVIYNEDAFSVDVYLEKNMIVSGKDKKDIMNNKITFVYYNGSWKILDITSI